MLRPDNLIPLTSGAYQARGLIADAQRCVNLYQEENPADTDPGQSVTHYTRPGLISKVKLAPAGRGRGVFTLSNGNVYAVAGQNVFAIDKYFQATQIGQLSTMANTPVSMSDNGSTGVLVDGSQNGYQIDLATNEFTTIADSTGSFQGATRVDFADTFLAFNTPGTNKWLTSLSNQVAFNALINGAKSSYPDPIQTIAFNLRQAWLIGTDTTEIWYLAGGATFPYAEWPNVFVPYGTAAPYSLAQADVDLFWLSHDRRGRALIVKTDGYAVIAISTRAIEFELSKYKTISDCIAYSYQQAGHTFVVFHFPTADKSWAYDLSTKQWHERAWTDHNGVLHRERVAFHTPGYNTNIGQDWQTGELYALDLETYTDNLQPIVCIRSFPHVVNELKEITHVAFVGDLAAGALANSGEVDQTYSPWSSGFSIGFGPLTTVEPPMINLRYSDDGGGSWSNYRRKGMLSAGRYRNIYRWRGLGMARDRVYELSWSAPMLISLQGAYLDPQLHGA